MSTAKRLITRWLKQAAIWLVQGITGAAIILFFAYMLAEWASGCGESYVDSKGVSHANECVWATTPTTTTIGK